MKLAILSKLFSSSALPRAAVNHPNLEAAEKPSKWGFSFSSAAKESARRQARERREKAIVDKLARYALIPATDIFSLNPEWSPLGLSVDSAHAARLQYGLNSSSVDQPLKPFATLAAALVSPFNILIALLASISIGTGDDATFTIMLIMIVLSTSLRTWQELQSSIKAAALLNSVTTNVRVLRPNPIRSSSGLLSEEVEIDRRQIVPGDVLTVASGDVFPGDCVLISASSLMVSQASLTGEIMPVDKVVRLSPASPEFAFDILDNENICLAGTSVATGNGAALVLSTGSETYMASVAKELERRRPANAMELGVRKVSLILLVITIVMAPVVFIIQGVLHRDWKGALLFAVAVAVGLTPEMLPMVVASNLALSAVRIARKKVIVKRFDAIQNLGAISILCSDKTGTLTVDSVRVSVSATETGAPSDLPVKLAYVNSVMQTGTRSPIDGAIVDYVDEKRHSGVFSDANLEGWAKCGELPFDSSRRLLSVLVSRPEQGNSKDVQDGLFITKGAVEEVLAICTRVFNHPNTQSDTDSSSLRLDGLDLESSSTSMVTPAMRRHILDTAERLNEDGYRLVAVGCKPHIVKPQPLSTNGQETAPLFAHDEDDLTFIGFVGFLDPPKEDAANAIAKLNKLNVQVRILTGDSPPVAAKVARSLGLLPSGNSKYSIPSTPGTISSADPFLPQLSAEKDTDVVVEMESIVSESDLIVTGSQLAALSSAADKNELREVVERAIIFAKLSPYQKLEVVEILRSGGGERAVAFLGDGVNDALAIRGADVGISVDSGTEIAKEAADVILLEKNLDVIVEGVLQGRTTFVNTIKYVKMAASSNFGNVFSVLVASAWLPYQPMLPLQLLVQNLLYDLSQSSIPWDNVDPEFLEKPKVWRVKSIVTFMLCMGPLSSPWDICTFLLNWFKYDIRTLDNPLVPRAQAHWFIEGSVTQLFIIHYLRTPKLPFIQSRASWSMTLVTTAITFIAMAIPWISGVNKALQFEHPDPGFYGFLVAILASYTALVHIGKALYLRIFKEWL